MTRDNSKRAIIKILCLYLGTTGIFLCVFFGFFYTKEKLHLMAEQVSDLREVSIQVYDILHTYKNDTSFACKQIENSITHHLRIYRNGEIVCDTLHVDLKLDEMKKGIVSYGDKVIIEPSMYDRYLKLPHFKRQEIEQKNAFLQTKSPKNSRYKIFIEDASLDSQVFFLRFKFIAYFIFLFLIVGAIAYFLVRFSLKPMQDTINSLNVFIKDSTHEINTPLSIILMSIEALSTDNFTQSQKQKIQRIKLASKSLSHLYKDLVAYSFPHTVSNKSENLDLESLLKERLEYFSPFFEQKSIDVNCHIESSHIMASAEKITCVIDNLLSNAIKYNKKGGKIDILLQEGRLSISDDGCGISLQDIEKIFERYVRCNDFQGGFGIGLTLIKQICDEYHIKIEVQSDVDNGSSFTLLWDNI